MEESEDTPPLIESDINTSMGVNVDKPEMQSIMSNQFYGGVLEFLCKYDNSDTGFHPFDPVKSDDAHSVSTYVFNHDLGQKENSLYHRWTRVLLQSTKRTIRRMKQSNLDCFHQ